MALARKKNNEFTDAQQRACRLLGIQLTDDHAAIEKACNARLNLLNKLVECKEISEKIVEDAKKIQQGLNEKHGDATGQSAGLINPPEVLLDDNWNIKEEKYNPEEVEKALGKFLQHLPSLVVEYLKIVHKRIEDKFASNVLQKLIW